MNYRDSQIIQHVNKHYNELLAEMKIIKSYEDFVSPENKCLQKALVFDILQIGESLVHLSRESASQISSYDLKGIIDTRNIVVLGYAIVKEKLIYKCIIEDLPRLMAQIKEIK